MRKTNFKRTVISAKVETCTVCEKLHAPTFLCNFVVKRMMRDGLSAKADDAALLALRSE